MPDHSDPFLEWARHAREVVDRIMGLIQAEAQNRDIRRAHADVELCELINSIMSVGVLAQSETDAADAYRAGSRAIDKVLRRIARAADHVHREANRRAGRASER